MGFAMSASANDPTARAAAAAAQAGNPPIGFIGAWPANAIPANWMELPLAATNISRTAYAVLLGAIGTDFGAGDGATTFGMPYVGADGTILASNANLGTATAGQVIAHGHSLQANSTYLNGAGGQHLMQYGGGAIMTDNFGGAQNTAAGSRMKWCIRYQ